MALESSLWNWLRRARLAFGPNIQLERIENLCGAGFPDVEGYVHTEKFAGQFTLELKSHERPARQSTPIRFPLRDREAQIEWMKKRWELGGNAFWLLQVGSGADRTLFLAPGDAGAELKRGLTESELFILCLGGCVWLRPAINHHDVIKRIVQCRRLPYQSQR